MLKGKKVLLVEDRQNAFASGMNGHIAKPIDVPQLKATIAKFV